MRTRLLCQRCLSTSRCREWLKGQLRSLAAQGVDVSKLKLDWNDLRKAQGERATRDVRASLILEKVAVAESIFTSQEEVDAELSRVSRQQREPIAAVRMRFRKRWYFGPDCVKDPNGEDTRFPL